MNRAQRRHPRAAPTGRTPRYSTRRNPVAIAVLLSHATAQMRTLQTAAGLHSYLGGDWAKSINAIGRYLYVVNQAALDLGLNFDTAPAMRVITGAASALGDVHEHPAMFEQQRQALIQGVQAAASLQPSLPMAALVMAAIKLDDMLASPQGLTLHDFTHTANTIRPQHPLTRAPQP
jgi:hypothetical protein